MVARRQAETKETLQEPCGLHAWFVHQCWTTRGANFSYFLKLWVAHLLGIYPWLGVGPHGVTWAWAGWALLLFLLFSSFLLYWYKTVASTQTLNLQLVFLRRLSSLSSHHTNGFSSYVSSHHLNCTRLSTTIDLCLAWSLWLSRLSSTSASPTPTPRSSVLRAPPPNGETFFGKPEGRYSDGRPIDHWLHRNGI